MDPLSMTGSIIAILQLTAHVSSYVNSCKNASKQQAKIAIETSSLYSLLTNLRFRVEEARSDDPWFNEVKLLNRTNGPLEQFKTNLEKLVEKAQLTASGTPLSKIKSTLTWKFDKSEVDDLLQQIERLKSLIDLALSKDHFVLSQATHDKVGDLAQDIQAIRSATDVKLVQEIKTWLRAPDPTINYEAACQKHVSGTGSWLPLQPVVQGWMQSQTQLIWLRGFAGCGKTILSSTMISNLVKSTQQGLDTVVAYFFFDFRDLEKQTTASLIRSLLAQICQFDDKGLEELRELHKRYGREQKQPHESETLAILKSSLLRLPRCHIVLDALDEARPAQKIKEECPNAHLFVTSRNEKDIEEVLSSIMDHSIDARNNSIDDDIRTFVLDCLEKMPRLRKWPPSVKLEIETALTQKAGGMFQWVNCQIEVLEKCLQLGALRKTLNSLPKSLDATYERILESIEANGYLDSALHVLRWLCFAVRPLTVTEVVDVLAIHTAAEDTGFAPDERLLDPEDLRLICANLIVFTKDPLRKENDNGKAVVNLAHYSIREYLLSTRCCYGSLFGAPSCHAHIAECCLLYLHTACTSACDISGSPWHQVANTHPLLMYAQYYARMHLKQNRMKLADHIVEIALKLFLDEKIFRTWLKMEFEEGFGISWHYNDSRLDFDGPFSQLPEPLFCAVCLGSKQIVEKLIETGVSVEPNILRYSPLGAAAAEGNDEMVKSLLQNGLIDFVGSDYGGSISGSAIAAAIEAGNRSTLELLINQRAATGNSAESLEYFVNVLSEDFYNYSTELSDLAFSLAVEGIVNPLLLVDESIRNHYISRAISILLVVGDTRKIEKLINSTSEIDFHAGGKCEFECLVNQAARETSWHVLQCLLSKAGDVCAIPEQTACALLSAAGSLRMEIVSQLLFHGADANSIANIDGTAVNAIIRCARRRNRESKSLPCLDAVKLLFEHGSDFNLRAGAFWLEGDSIWPGEEEYGIDGEIYSGLGKFLGSPLQLAIQANDVELVQLLLEKGADPNLADDPLGSAYLAALIQGKSNVVQLLAARDTSVKNTSANGKITKVSTDDEQCDELVDLIVSCERNIADALTLATKWNRLEIVKALLRKTDRLEQGIHGYLPSLGIAIANEYWDILESLINHGADLEVATWLSVKKCHTGHTKWLLKRYAAEIRDSGPQVLTRALKEAMPSLYSPEIMLLLDYGADLDMEENGQSAMDCLPRIVSERELDIDNARLIVWLLSKSRKTNVVNEILALLELQFKIEYKTPDDKPIEED